MLKVIIPTKTADTGKTYRREVVKSQKPTKEKGLNHIKPTKKEGVKSHKPTKEKGLNHIKPTKKEVVKLHSCSVNLKTGSL